MLVHPYRVKHGDLARTLAAKKDDFEKMTILSQGKILLEMLYIFRANATNANLSALGGSSRAGMPRISKYVKDDKETSIHLINQSVTGFFEQDIDLMGDTF
jgi:hypothetical protein